MKRASYIQKLKKELFISAISVVMTTVALASATYAWYVANNTVDATTSTISARANGMVLQIVEGNTPDHGSDTATVASGVGHEISPSSTNDIKNWYVPATWKGTDVNTYLKPTLDATGKYTVQKDNFYAYSVSQYTLYTVNNTGTADVYLDNSTANGPVMITPSDGATQEWFNKIKGSLRVGIVIGDELKVVYAPVTPSETEAGNDVNKTIGWSCVDESLTKTIAPTYKHVDGINLTDQTGSNWGATKSGESYVKPSGRPAKVADKVDYNGISMKIYIWMEGTDSDCVNMTGLKEGMKNPTFDVTVSLVGIVPES